MEILECGSDRGAVLIGNNDWAFAVPNGYGDGETKVTIWEEESEEFLDYEKKRKLRFLASAEGTFNIYKNDCADFKAGYNHDIWTTLQGRYGVYYGTSEVAFVKWE